MLKTHPPILEIREQGAVLLGKKGEQIYEFQAGTSFSSSQEIRQFFLDEYKKEGVSKGIESQLSIVADPEIAAFSEQFGLDAHVKASMLQPLFFDYFVRVLTIEPQREEELRGFLLLCSTEFENAVTHVSNTPD